MQHTSCVNNYFLDLLKIAVKNKEQLSSVPTNDEWEEIYKIAKQQTLLGFLFPAIEQLPKEQRPPKILLMQWFAITETIKSQNEIINLDAI